MGTGCLLPYTAHTQILWPDNAKHMHTHTHAHTESQGLSNVICIILLNKILFSVSVHCLIVYYYNMCLCVMHIQVTTLFFVHYVELTSQSSLMCFANVV